MSDNLFNIPFHYFSQDTYNEIRNYVQRLSAHELKDEDDLVQKLKEKYTLDKLVVDWDNLRVLPNPREKESYVRDVFGEHHRTITPVYTFEVPFSGSPKLFSIQPSTSRVLRIEGRIAGGKFTFEIEGSDKARLEQIKEGVQFNLDNQTSEVLSHNSGVESTARSIIEGRLHELKEHNDGLDAFGVPIKK